TSHVAFVTPYFLAGRPERGACVLLATLTDACSRAMGATGLVRCGRAPPRFSPYHPLRQSFTELLPPAIAGQCLSTRAPKSVARTSAECKPERSRAWSICIDWSTQGNWQSLPCIPRARSINRFPGRLGGCSISKRRARLRGGWAGHSARDARRPIQSRERGLLAAPRRVLAKERSCRSKWTLRKHQRRTIQAWASPPG